MDHTSADTPGFNYSQLPGCPNALSVSLCGSPLPPAGRGRRHAKPTYCQFLDRNVCWDLMKLAVQHWLRVLCFVNNHGTVYWWQSQLRKYCTSWILYRADHLLHEASFSFDSIHIKRHGSWILSDLKPWKQNNLNYLIAILTVCSNGIPVTHVSAKEVCFIYVANAWMHMERSARKKKSYNTTKPFYDCKHFHFSYQPGQCRWHSSYFKLVFLQRKIFHTCASSSRTPLTGETCSLSWT